MKALFAITLVAAFTLTGAVAAQAATPTLVTSVTVSAAAGLPAPTV
jgi:hypothetical protein